MGLRNRIGNRASESLGFDQQVHFCITTRLGPGLNERGDGVCTAKLVNINVLPLLCVQVGYQCVVTIQCELLLFRLWLEDLCVRQGMSKGFCACYQLNLLAL
jgi:hypothetical protein